MSRLVALDGGRIVEFQRDLFVELAELTRLGFKSNERWSLL